MQESLIYIWDRLHRAEEHFEAIKDHLITYYRSELDGIRGEYDPKEQDAGEFGFHSRPDLPAVRMQTLVGELLHDLRTSLDHLAWQLVLENGGTPTEDTTFPVLKVAPSANK